MNGNNHDRRLKNAIHDCIRCFHGGEVWGEPDHVEMVNANVATLSAILMEMDLDVPSLQRDCYLESGEGREGKERAMAEQYGANLKKSERSEA